MVFWCVGVGLREGFLSLFSCEGEGKRGKRGEAAMLFATWRERRKGERRCLRKWELALLAKIYLYKSQYFGLPERATPRQSPALKGAVVCVWSAESDCPDVR